MGRPDGYRHAGEVPVELKRADDEFLMRSTAGSGKLGTLTFLALVALAFLLGCFEMGDFDVWWHLRTGELIPERGVPLSDWFSFTAGENAWIDVQWGFQVAIAWVHTQFGIKGLILAKSGVAAAAVAIAWSAGRSSWPLLVRILVWIPALLLMSSRFFPRPEIVTLAFTAVYLSVLFHAERRPVLLWLLPMVQVLWANFHGLFVFGPILIAMYWTQAILRMDRVHGIFRHLVPVTLLVLGACVVSPYRIANVELIRELWLKMGRDGQIYRDNISELTDLMTFWREGGAQNAYVLLLVGLLGLGAFSLLLAWRQILLERRLFQVLPLVAFGFLAVQATRNGNHFALVAAVVIGWNLCAPRWMARLSGTAGNAFALGLVLLAIYAVGSGRWYLLAGEGRRIGLDIRPHHYSLESMQLAGKEGMPDRALLFHLGHASTYIHQNGPERKVFMDARLELHSQQEFHDYIALRDWMSTGNGPWQQALHENGIDLVFADSQQSAAIQATLFSDPAWVPIWFDEVLTVFRRRDRALPPGVSPVEMRTQLFKVQRNLATPLPKPSPPPSWWLVVPEVLYPAEADELADALLRLGTALTGRSPYSSLTRSAALWNAAAQSIDAIERRPWAGETYRTLGVSLALLNADKPPVQGETPWSVTEVVPALSAATLRKAIVCDPNDFSATFYLADRLHAIGATDWAVEMLERLRTRPPKNRAQAQMLASLPGILTAWKAEMHNVSTGGPMTLTASIQSGRLGEYLKASAAPKSQDTTELDQIAGAFLAAGLVRNAEHIYDLPAMKAGLEAAQRQLRLGTLALADGNFPAAEKAFQAAGNETETAASAAYGLAVLNLLRGDRPAVLRQVEVGLAANPREDLRAALTALQQLAMPSRN